MKDKEKEYYAYKGEEDVIFFKRGEDLFKNFGFATTTTTFPCLCFSVEKVRKLSVSDFYKISPIYSHTFAFYVAFFNSPCMFIPKPLVRFSFNPEMEEYIKLESKNKNINRTSYYHAAHGYLLHVNNISRITGVSISDIVMYREDQVNKDSDIVIPTTSGAFVLDACLAQMHYELSALYNGKEDITFTTVEEIEEQKHFFSHGGVEIFRKILDAAVYAYSYLGGDAFQAIEYIWRLRLIVQFIGRKIAVTEFDDKSSQISLELPFGEKRGIVLDGRPENPLK